MKTTPMLVCLSGSLKGCTFTPKTAPVTIGTGTECIVRYPPVAGQPVGELHAEIIADNGHWVIHQRGDLPVVVNDEVVAQARLAQNDLIRLGDGGPLVRFRLTRRGTATRTFRQMVHDTRLVVGESHPRGGTMLRAKSLAVQLARDAVSHGTRRLKIGLAVSLLLILSLAGFLGYRLLTDQTRDKELDERLRKIQGHGDALVEQKELLQDRIDAQNTERERLEGDLARERDRREALEETLRTLDQRLETDARTLRDLVERAATVDINMTRLTQEVGAAQQIHQRFSRAVGIVCVGVAFKKKDRAETWVTRRMDPARPGHAGRGFDEGGNGPRYVEWVTGSGFLVSKDGLILTNRHVAEPWWEAPDFGGGLRQGFSPEVVGSFVCFPGVKVALPVEIARLSEQEDLALLRCTTVPDGLSVVELPQEQKPVVGGKVVLLGYPEGISGLLNKLDPTVAKKLEAIDKRDSERILRVIAAEGGISPTITQGVLSDVTTEYLVYDAATTGGGSGGPVFSSDGQVLGINTAVSSGGSYALHLAPAHQLISRWAAKR